MILSTPLLTPVSHFLYSYPSSDRLCFLSPPNFPRGSPHAHRFRCSVARRVHTKTCLSNRSLPPDVTDAIDDATASHWSSVRVATKAPKAQQLVSGDAEKRASDQWQSSVDVNDDFFFRMSSVILDVSDRLFGWLYRVFISDRSGFFKCHEEEFRWEWSCERNDLYTVESAIMQWFIFLITDTVCTNWGYKYWNLEILIRLIGGNLSKYNEHSGDSVKFKIYVVFFSDN